MKHHKLHGPYPQLDTEQFLQNHQIVVKPEDKISIQNHNSKVNETNEKRANLRMAKTSESRPLFSVLTEKGKSQFITKPEQMQTCEYQQPEHYQICAERTCDECSAIAFCGWCAKSNTCVPGSHRGPECDGDCLQGWIFHDPKICTSSVRSGLMTNVHPEAKQLINPELAKPKYRRTRVEEENLVRHYQVISGTEDNSVVHQKNDDLYTMHKRSPHLSPLQEVFPLKRTVETSIHDIDTHERLDKVPQQLALHGIEDEQTEEKSD